jgi:hypothetical protein
LFLTGRRLLPLRALEHDPEKHALGRDPRVDIGFPKRSCSINKLVYFIFGLTRFLHANRFPLDAGLPVIEGRSSFWVMQKQAITFYLSMT